MPRLHKLRRKQKFRFDKNRKRMQKTQDKTNNANIKVTNKLLKDNWDARKPLKQNMDELGIAYDPNTKIGNASLKQTLVAKVKQSSASNNEQTTSAETKKDSFIAQELEKRANDAKASKKSTFRFNGEEVKWITAMMDKHGDDFQAMARDSKNVWQHTPKQIQQKVVKFINIPEQFAEYAKSRGLLDSPSSS